LAREFERALADRDEQLSNAIGGGAEASGWAARPRGQGYRRLPIAHHLCCVDALGRNFWL